MNDVIMLPNMSVGIVLAASSVTAVEFADYSTLADHRWWISGTTEHPVIQCGRSVDGHGNYHMHRVLTGAPRNYIVDHIDRNPLNNRRDNLRVCTHAENAANRGLPANNTLGYKGVCPFRGRFRAYGVKAGIQTHLGLHATADRAAEAYDAWPSSVRLASSRRLPRFGRSAAASRGGSGSCPRSAA